MSIQQPDKFLFDVLVNLTVASECFAALLIPGQCTDKAGVFYLLIEIADKGTTRHVAAGYLIDVASFLFTGFGIENGDDSFYFTGSENALDCIVVFLRLLAPH